MAARLTKGTKDVPWDQRTRDKIKTSMLVNRLSDHALNGNDMSPSQIRAAEILLNKTLANLSATEIVGAVATYVARLPQPAADTEAWLASVNPAIPALAPIVQSVDIIEDNGPSMVIPNDSSAEDDDYKAGD